MIRLGVDIGGTFTDLVAWDGARVRVVKVQSTPPNFEKGVLEAVARALGGGPDDATMIHGSTVATNALLQRAGARVAFVTTSGFRDLLLIGTQNRPSLYALNVRRAAPITPQENWFTVDERIDARGRIVKPLDETEIERLMGDIQTRGLRDVAVCLLFGFVNPEHEKRIAARLSRAGLRVSIGSEVLPEFREFQRASTTAINASLGPVASEYLGAMSAGLPSTVREVRVMHSGGGTFTVADAARQASRMVLSGPAGGVYAAAMIARCVGVSDAISYDMGGTSTDVAGIVNGEPQWTSSTVIDGLHIGLPMFDVHTIGAGGGSVAWLDAGGALRVGPRSAGASPGPACYGRGGTEPTVTDANLVLGRIDSRTFLDGAMPLDATAAHRAVQSIADRLGMSLISTALGIVRVVEAGMCRAIQAVSSRRGLDPRRFALVSFGGAGGLHACALARGLGIGRVIVPAQCGVLSALGMVAAPALVDVSQSVIHLKSELNDELLCRSFDELHRRAREALDDPAETLLFADARLRGQSHELSVRIDHPSIAQVTGQFLHAYDEEFGRAPHGHAVEIVTLRIRRRGPTPALTLPRVEKRVAAAGSQVNLVDSAGTTARCRRVSRGELLGEGSTRGPLLIVDPDATTYMPADWNLSVRSDGIMILEPHAP
ncbi:MAG: hydantoinase/oxoprolinase family protein [Tepidisphaeraceae bacterium]